MEARLKHPISFFPEAGKGIQAINKSVYESGIDPKILELAHLRASQINGCGACVDGGIKHALKSGETDERLHGVAVWRELPYYSDAERAALNLTEHATRLSDRADAAPDDVWDEARKHFDDKQLAGLVLMIALTNFYNRLNVTTRQPPFTW